jgi:FkbM family methyltransferase
MGEGLRDRLRILRMLGYAHTRLGRGRALLGWLPLGEDRPMELALRSGVTLWARRRDAVPLYEQFGLDAYGVGIDARTVLDLGANVGFAAVALARHHPGARVICVEPDPESCVLLQRNVTRNGVDALVLRAAVAGAPGRFDVVGGSAPASNRVVRAEQGGVEGITVSEVLSRAGIGAVDLMKVDIEGAEAEVFADAASWAPRVGAVIAELHEPFGVSEADRLLAPHGFVLRPLAQGARFRDVTLWTRV